ncbi:hypothetical protein QRQ56_30755 [Bradyrhizobium sp. U531]
MVRRAPQGAYRGIGGATSFVGAPGEGLGRSGGGTARDGIVVVEVMTERFLADYWSGLRKRLESELAQVEMASAPSKSSRCSA